MKAKKKRLIALIALIAALGAVIAVLVFVKNRKEETEPYVSPYTSLVYEDSTTITDLSFGKVGEEALGFTYADYKWNYTADKDFPVSSAVLDEMAKSVSSVSAVRTIEGEEKEEYGLGDGALHITAAFSDGKEIDLTVGALNSFNSYTYIKDGAGKIYMFSDSLTEAFSKELDDLIELDDPEGTVDTNYLVALDVSDGNGNSNSITDTAGMRALFDQSGVYDCLDWVEYAVGSDRFAEYGIDDGSAKLVIRYKAAHSVTDDNGESSTIRVEEAYEIIFGDRFEETDENDEAAEYVYYTVSKSSIVYKIPVSAFEETMAYLDYVPESSEDETQSETDAKTGDAATGDASAESEGMKVEYFSPEEEGSFVRSIPTSGFEAKVLLLDEESDSE